MAGQVRAREGRPSKGAAREGRPGHGHVAEAVIDRGTGAAAYPSFEGAVACVGTDLCMDDDIMTQALKDLHGRTDLASKYEAQFFNLLNEIKGLRYDQIMGF
jgi:hypothetical protein